MHSNIRTRPNTKQNTCCNNHIVYLLVQYIITEIYLWEGNVRFLIQVIVLVLSLMGPTVAVSTPSFAGANGSVCTAAVEDVFFSANFKCARVMEIAYEHNFGALENTSKAEILAYIKAIDGAMEGQMALFLMSPELLVERDPKLSFKIAKAMLTKGVAEDAIGEAVDIFGKVLGEFTKERMQQTQASTINPFDEGRKIFGGAADSIGSAAILWAGRYGKHDAEMLMVLSQQNSETAVAIYKGLVGIVEVLQ